MKTTVLFFVAIFMATFHFLNAHEVEIKYINGPIMVGAPTTYTGTYYFNGCIEFTAAQMQNYQGGALHTVRIALNNNVPKIAPTGHKVWLKDSKGGSVVYIQDWINPQAGTWHDIVLNTAYIIPENSSLAIGYTFCLENLTPNDYVHPFAHSGSSEDPYQPGGYNFHTSELPNAYEGDVWQVFSGQGNLAIIGLATITLPTVDLGVSPLSYPEIDFKLVEQEYIYYITVTNFGSEAQSHYIVQMIDENDDVLAEQTITSTIAPGASTLVGLPYTSFVAGHLPFRAKVIIAGDAVPENNISTPTYFKLFPEQPMSYVVDSDNFGRGWRYNEAGWVHLAFRYPAVSMEPLVGKELKGFYYAVQCAADCVVPPATVWVRTGSLDNPKTVLGTHNNIVEGWNYCEFPIPYTLTNEETYVGVSYFTYPNDWYNTLLNISEDLMPKDYVNAMLSTIADEGIEPTEGDWWAGGHEFGNNVLIAVVGPPTVGIKKIVKTDFTVVPNPAKDKIKISAESNFNKVEVINFLGQTVITQNNDTNHTTLDVSNLTNGVYFVRIISGNGTNVQKFVKQ